MKKMFLLALVIVLCLSLSACSMPGVSVTDSLSPPKPSGELYDIQKALELSAGHDVDLVYPSAGDYRSAIITKDIDSDGKLEAFALYSTETDDKTTVMHINYIRWLNGKWSSVTDLQVNVPGVESVDFVRLDNDQTLKVLVNWERYSATNKQLSVYSITSGELQEVTKADYSVYATCDFDGNGISEIVAVYLDAEKKTSTATLLALGEGGFSERSSCKLDPTVTSYFQPVLSKFTNGQTAVFIDAVKSNGMFTEILSIDKKGKLYSALPHTASFENVNSFRASAVNIADFDGDGCVDIPLARPLPMVSSENGEQTAYMTTWNSFDGNEYTALGNMIINYTDGYYINIPDNWVENIAVERRLDSRQRVFYRWDPLTFETGEEILRIMAVPLKSFNQNPDDYKDYTEYARSSEYVFAVKYSSSALTPDKDYFKQNLKPINPVE